MTEDTSETVDTDTSPEKDWFHAVEVYNKLKFQVASNFLDSDHAKHFGLDQDDIREFRRAVHSFDAKWQAAAKAFKEGKYPTRKKFVSSGKFLRMGFTPCREHAETLKFALKFYEEEILYRENANSDEVTTQGRWGGTVKPMFVENKSRIPDEVIGFETNDIEASRDDRSIPSLVQVDDDTSSATSSRNSGTSSVTCSLSDSSCSSKQKVSVGDLDSLLDEFSDCVEGNNPWNVMIFLLFAILPILVFAKVRSAVLIIIRSGQDSEKVKGSTDIEMVWEEMKADALLTIGEIL